MIMIREYRRPTQPEETHLLFLPAVVPPPTRSNDAWWFLFHGDRLLVEVRGLEVAIPRWASAEDAGLFPVRTQFLGTLDGVPCYSGELAGEVGPEGTSFRALRPLLGALPEEMFSLAGRAFQVMDWDRTHQFCGKCGGRTDPLDGERGRVCAGCGLHFFPRVTPAVIVAVVRHDKILLAQSSRFPAAFYSVLAGFVEPGETLAAAVAREVHEEVGIRQVGVGDLAAVLQAHLAERAERLAGERDVLVGDDDRPSHGDFGRRCPST